MQGVVNHLKFYTVDELTYLIRRNFALCLCIESDMLEFWSAICCCFFLNNRYIVAKRLKIELQRI